MKTFFLSLFALFSAAMAFAPQETPQGESADSTIFSSHRRTFRFTAGRCSEAKDSTADVIMPFGHFLYHVVLEIPCRRGLFGL